MALTATQTAITKVYLGAFNRAPEKSGLEYWTSEITAGKTLNQVIDTIFSLPVVKAIYPDTMSNTEFLTAVYTNVFGKAPDAEGLAYWNSQLTAGTERGRVVITMIDAGMGTPDGTPGKAFITNRMQAAVTSADLQLTRGIEVDEHRQIALMQEIGETPASLSAGLAAIDRATPVPILAAAGQPTGTATAATDRFIFTEADANNFKVINGLAVGDQVSVAFPDDTNGDYRTVAETSAAAVNARGEWFFNSATDSLTYWNNDAASAVSVQLAGVATLSVDTNAVFTVTALG